MSPLGGPDRKLSDQPAGGQLFVVARRPMVGSGRGRLESSQGTSEAEERGIQLIAVSDGAAHVSHIPSPRIYDSRPAFSPDGHLLAYASCRFGGLACRVDIVGLDANSVPAGASRRLTRSVLWGPGGLAFSRDGQSVVYGDYKGNGLWRVGISGERPPERIEVAGVAVWPAVSLSRDRLAFQRGVGHLETYRSRWAARRSWSRPRRGRPRTPTPVFLRTVAASPSSRAVGARATRSGGRRLTDPTRCK